MDAAAALCGSLFAMWCALLQTSSCKRGDACPFAHGVFETWLHPARYRTQMCTDGVNCRRRVCFFAHADSELRQPEEDNVAGEEQLLDTATGGWASTPCRMSAVQSCCSFTVFSSSPAF
jgi:hypothetical protein